MISFLPPSYSKVFIKVRKGYFCVPLFDPEHKFIKPMKLKNLLVITLSFWLLLLTSSVSRGQNLPSGLKIWFNHPAETWNDALPIGNGRLGAMVFGGVEKERLELNEESVWTGEPRWDANPDARKSLPKVRQLLFDGKYKEAEELADKGILGNKPRNPVATYQALGDLYLNFGPQRDLSNYHRELDIEDAIARISYSANQINFLREVFSSAPDQAVIIRLTADKPGALTFTSRLSRTGSKAVIVATGNEITMNEHVGDGIGVKMFARLKLVADGGTIVSGGDSINVDKANSVTIFLTAATDYFGGDPSVISKTQMDAAVNHPYADARKSHIADYQSLFKRVDLDLGTSDGNYFATDARITAMQNGYVDTDLIELYYQFGRYLLISSSRPGDLPANLHGMWADGLNHPRSADYHININIQTNYCPSESTNIG